MQPSYAYTPAEEQRGRRSRRPVVVVGGGPVGLTAAIDIALKGVPVCVLDQKDETGAGSRAVCWAKRTLEIWNRLGCAAPLMDKGVSWRVGKVFHRDRLVHRFDLLPEPGHAFPAFINLPQSHVEDALQRRAAALQGIALHWRHQVTGVIPGPDGVSLRVETPEGAYRMDCDWLIAADGAHSFVRRALGLTFAGQVFHDRFLIADVIMRADFPPERRFWFDPPFHPGGSALLHMQPDNVWRLDFQLGPDADAELERRPERVIPRLRAMLGPDVAFELEWVSVYTFQCRRLERFRHGRVIFAGDAAHQLSPFGARGANSGVQDAENLAWKLAMVAPGGAPERLLDSYGAEREAAADENIRHATRSTEFITPKSPASRALRDAVLDLAADCPFARQMINSGRLSTPTVHQASPLNTPDRDDFAGGPRPGAPAVDAPLGDGWLLDRTGGDFMLLCFGEAPDAPLPRLRVTDGLAAARYDARPGTVYLLRPDQHVAARWRRPDPADIAAALRRATAAP